MSSVVRSVQAPAEPRVAAFLEAPMPASCEHPGVPVRVYLHKLLDTLLEEGEGFSGKRPFGNSGWMLDLVAAAISAGAIKGRLDSDGYVDNHDRTGFAKLLRQATAELFKAPAA